MVLIWQELIFADKKVPQKHLVCNWKAYNTALKKRGDLFFYFDVDAVKNGWDFKGKQRPGGQRKYSDEAISMILSLKSVLRLPLRQTQGLVESLINRLGFSVTTPDYSTLCRRAKTLPIMVKQYGRVNSSEPLHLVVDSTGLSIYSATYLHCNRHMKERLGKRGASWQKLHIAYDLSSYQIVNGHLSESHIQDASPIEIITEVPGRTVASLRADKAYDKRLCYRRAYELKAQAIIPPMKNARTQIRARRGSSYEQALASRDQAISLINQHSSYEEGVSAWKRQVGYHQRSHIEAVNHRFKRAFGYSLSSKSTDTRKVEVNIKLSILNKQTTLGRASYVRVI